MEIIAHRGASWDAPENTLAAIRIAWAQAADAVELDLRLSRDGELVLMHDPNTRRTAGCDQLVAAQSSAELQALDAGLWKGAAWAGERIPLLSAALAALPRGRRLFLELKIGPEALLPLRSELRNAGTDLSQIVFLAFDHAMVSALRKGFPTAHVHWLVGRNSFECADPPAALASVVAQARAAGADGLGLDCRIPLSTASVAAIAAAGLQLVVWTVDEPALARRLVRVGVRRITTNRPAFLRASLCHHPSAV